MAGYTPGYAPGDTITRLAAADITGGQLVRVAGSGVVAPTSAASSDWLGVAAQDTTAGDLVTVFLTGTQRLGSAVQILAGQPVEGAAGGLVAPHTLGTNDTNIVGTALTTITAAQAAAGQLVEVVLSR